MAHTHKIKKNKTIQHTTTVFHFPFRSFPSWPYAGLSSRLPFRFVLNFCVQRPSVYAQGKFKKSGVFQLGSRFVGQTPHSGHHREDFVTDQKFRVGRPGEAVCRTRIQILTEKCILRIPLSSDFLQIIGRKQIDGRIQKFGLEFKGLSAIESNSNLA